MSEEQFYRVINRSQPYSFEKNKISSALFKDPKGLSMDKKGERNEDDAVKFMENYFRERFKGVARLGHKKLEKAETYIENSPSEKNEYHVQVYENSEKDPISSLKALILADSAELVLLKDKPDWLYSWLF